MTDNSMRHDGTGEMKEAGRDAGDAVEHVGNTLKEETKDLGRDIHDTAADI